MFLTNPITIFILNWSQRELLNSIISLVLLAGRHVDYFPCSMAPLNYVFHFLWWDLAAVFAYPSGHFAGDRSDG